MIPTEQTPAPKSNVVPLRPRRHRRDAEVEDFPLMVPNKRPFVKPGRYIGVITAVKKENFRGMRDLLKVLFDVWENEEALGNGEAPVARGIPGFFPLGGGPGSKYARLLQIIFRGDIANRHASDLIGKALEIDVATVVQDSEENKTPDDVHYSKMSQVLSRAL
jgi:hypothetical protein